MAVNSLKNFKIVLICIILFLVAVLLVFLIKDSQIVASGFSIKGFQNIGREENLSYNSSNVKGNVKGSEDPLLLYELIPNTRLKYNGWIVKFKTTIQTINSGGFRGREYSIEKPSGVYRIVVLGDSLTFGQGVNDNETFPYYLEELLNKKNISAKRFEVLNFGVPGYNTLQEVEAFKVKALKYSPDLVIIAHVSNDIENVSEIQETCHKLYDEYLSKPYKMDDNLNLKGYFTDKSEEMYYSKIKKMPFDEVFQIVQIPMEELYNLSVSKNFSLMIMHFPSSDTQNEKLSNFSNRKGLCYLDLQKAYIDKHLYKEILHPKDPHPTPYAYQVVSEYISNKIFECGILDTSAKSYFFGKIY